MKKLIKLSSIIGLGIMLYACEKPELELTELPLKVTAPQTGTNISVQFIDESTGKEVSGITPKITGPSANRISNNSFSRNYKVVGGVLDLLVIPNEGNKPTEANPVKFTIEVDENDAGNSAYISSDLSVSISSEGLQIHTMYLTPNKTSTAGQAGAQVLVIPTLVQGARYTTPVDADGRSMSIKVDTIFKKASVRTNFKKATTNRIVHNVNVFKKMTVIGNKYYEFVSEFKVNSTVDAAFTVDIILTKAELDRFTNLNNPTTTHLTLKPIKSDDVPNISGDDLPAPPPVFKKAGTNSIAIFENITGGWYNVTDYEGRKVSIIGDTMRITNVRGNKIALAIEGPKASTEGELPNFRLYPDNFLARILTFEDNNGKGRLNMTVKEYILKIHEFPNLLTERGNIYEISSMFGRFPSINGTYKIGDNPIELLYEVFKKDFLGPAIIRSISVEGKCKNGNTVYPNAVIRFRSDGEDTFYPLGVLKNGKFETFEIRNDISYQFKVIYAAKEYVFSNKFTADQTSFVLDFEMPDAECAKLSPN